uniref:NAD(P)-binding domain-containing protein n=1 Tax=Fusarium oxysporum (strain Fo5176) TaxID=660025 RepID=A0A0C4DJ41_FUSOF
MSRHVLIIGGHGRIAQILTQQLLKKSWTVTSLIRSQDQVSEINSLATADQGDLNVLVRNLEHVHDTSQARSILDEVKPHTVVWCAGAGGEARPDQRPSWWDEDAWIYAQEMQRGGLLSYCQAKLAADEILLQEASTRANFSGISLRLGILSDEPAGLIELGKTTTSRGSVSRASVAEVIVSLLEHETVRTAWLDMLDGAEDIETAVERVVNDRENAAEKGNRPQT